MGRLTLSGADKAERLAYRAAFIPKDARLVPGPSGCAVYRYDVNRQGVAVFGAIAFRGTAGKPEWHYTFRTDERRTQAITGFWDSVKDAAARRAASKAVKAAWVNPLTVGTILSTCWGYDQTNVEFYAVTRVSGKRVWIREIAADYEETGFMSGRTWPAMPIRFTGAETMHVAQSNGSTGVSIKISHHYAHVEDGRAHHTSSYA